MLFEPQVGQDWDTVTEANWKLLQSIDAAAAARGELLWRYIKYPVADGYAFYQIIRVTKTRARIRVCTGLGDDWHVLAWGREASIPLQQAREFVRRQDGLAALFARK